MKIYTRTGDDGSTGLFGTERVLKSDLRLECYGTLDELNAHLGLAAAIATDPLFSQLLLLQNELFVIGSHLATPANSPGLKHLPPLHPAIVSRLEQEIDAAEAQLTPLKQFI